MNNLLQTLFDKRGFGYGLCAGFIGAVLLLLMARALADHVPLYDELLHFLSAQGLRETGEPAIAGGQYTRAWLYTQLVAVSFSFVGETLVAARVPALVAAMCLIMVLTVWVTLRAGLLAGIAAGFFLCILPETVELAVFARFYTLHALLIVVMSVAAYEAADVGRRLSSRVLLVALAMGLAPIALHLQETTVIATGALACGIAAVVIFDQWAWVSRFIRRYPIQVVVGISVALAIGLLLVTKLGLLDKMGQAPLWNEWAANRPLYYLADFAEEMPLLWPLYPVAVVLALLGHPRLTIFSTVVLLSGLTVHSIAAAKSLRYVFYLLPYFCIVLGCALSVVFGLVRTAVERTGRKADSRVDLAVMLLVAVVLASSNEGRGAARLLVGKSDLDSFGLGNVSEPDWSPLLPVLSPVLANSDRVVTSNAMKALYYLGKYDYELNASIVLETDTGTEFGIDQRTGGKAIGAADSVKQVIAMPGQTLVVLENKKIGVSVGASSEAMQVITSQCQPVELPAEVAVHAWTCFRP